MDEETARDEGNRALYNRFTLTIYTYICQHISNTQDAEDLLVEVFLAAFNNEALVNLSADRQLAWLLRVTRNKMVDRYRHLSLLKQVPIELASEMTDDAPTPEQYMERQENYDRLYQALEKLMPIQRELIQLRYSKGMSFPQIACIFQKSESAVRKLYERTLQQLRVLYYQIEGGKER